MCWMCEHPGATNADYMDHLRGLIAEHGWAVQGVERDGRHPPWAYTVGLTARHLPELLITGSALPAAAAVLNEMAPRAGTLSAGEEIRLPGGRPAQIVTVGTPWAHMDTAVALYGQRITALQVVHADRRGRWPWDAGYQGVRGGQPVLGTPGRQGPDQPGQ